MRKITKLYLAIICLSAFLLVGMQVNAEVTDNTVQPTVTSIENLTKKPIGRKELAMKFIIAMLAVGASSIMIYVLLTIYNRFIYGTKSAYDKTEDDDYKTPNNMKDALEIFFKKTKI